MCPQKTDVPTELVKGTPGLWTPELATQTQVLPEARERG